MITQTVSKDLFFALDHMLIEVLNGLSLSEWELPTVAGTWTVKDISAHLLDGNIRSLSMLRDHYQGERPSNIRNYGDLIIFLNKLNDDWVTAMRRVSPKQIVDMLANSGAEYCQYISSLDVDQKSVFSVAWAGEDQSTNGFHIAREYTEKWHHQQQIRLAVGQEVALYNKKFYLPYLNTSMQAVPHFYRDVPSEKDDAILIEILEPINEKWIFIYDGKSWHLSKNLTKTPTTKVRIDATIAWRIMTSSKPIENVRHYVKIEGNERLGEKFLEVRAVMV